ncbi:MAG: hypothetical protein J6P62_11840 [Bacteroidales bacterium]|nr:hypothetical protein [Bacteroidales bacterium]
MTVWIEDRNAERRHEAEVIRGVGLRLFNLQLAKGKSLKPHEFMPFPWDEEEKPDDGGLSEMTEEERKASMEKLKELINW